MTEQNKKIGEIIVDETLREEYVSIYDKNDNLIVKSCNPLVIENVRYQIIDKDLKGYYAVNENGERCEVTLDSMYFPFQDKIPRITAKILKRQIEHDAKLTGHDYDAMNL